VDAPQSQTRDWPLWWFARLENALERGDHAAARLALRNLDRLGIEIRFVLPLGRKEAAHA